MGYEADLKGRLTVWGSPGMLEKPFHRRFRIESPEVVVGIVGLYSSREIDLRRPAVRLRDNDQ